MKLLLYAFAIGFIGVSTALHAQVQQNIGIQADQSYSSTDIDSVNLLTGNVTDFFPVVTFPQKGNLPPLTFSFSYNSNPWWRQATCDSYSEECVVYYTDNAPALPGISAILNAPLVDTYSTSVPQGSSQLLYDSGDVCDSSDPEIVMECVAGYDSNVGPIIEQYNRTISVTDDTGAQHSLYFDSTNPNWARAGDGSGFAFYAAGNYDAWTFFGGGPTSDIGTFYDEAGNYISGQLIPGGPPLSSGTNTLFSDVYGNSLTMTTTGLTDSVGRPFPSVPYAADPASLSKCPSIGNALQPTAYAETWSVPGLNGGSQDYIVCYTSFWYHPGFFDGSSTGSTSSAPWHCDDTISQWSAESDSEQYTVANGTEPYNSPITCDVEIGATAIQAIVLPNGAYWGFTYDAGQTSPCDNVDGQCTSISYGTIQTVTLPSGAQISYQYQNYTNDWSVAYYLNFRMLTQRTVTDVAGITRSTNYQYQGFSTTSPRTVETDAAGNDIVHIFGASRTSTAPTYDPYTAASSAIETETDHYQGSSIASSPILLSKDVTTYVGQQPNGTIPDINVRPQSIAHYEGSALTQTKTFAYPSYNTYQYYVCTGQTLSSCVPTYPTTILRDTQTQVVVTDSDGTISQTINTPLDLAQPAYAAENILNKLSSTVIQDGNGNPIAETDYGYDENGGSAAENTSITKQLYGGTAVKSSFSYLADGALLDSRDPIGTHTHINSYQCNDLYPESVTAAYGSTTTTPETTSTTVDCNTGKTLSSTDANGIITAYDYQDPLVRPTRVRTAVGTPQEAWTQYSYPTMNEVDVAQDLNTKGDGALSSEFISDGVGHVTHSVTPGGVQQDYHYNAVGLMDWESNPYYSTNDPTYDQTLFTYDAMGRLTQRKTASDNQVQQRCYNGIQSTGQSICRANISSYHGGTWIDSSDENGNLFQSVSDGAGRLVRVEEPGSLETQYGYDSLNNLTSVNQLGNVATDQPRTRGFTYDSLSRLTTSQNPETGTICYGQWTNGKCLGGYDGNGNLLYKTDARGVLTTYQYDALNRLLAKIYSNDPAQTLSSCYQYDTSGNSPANAVGRATASWTQSGACSASLPSSGVVTSRQVLAYDPMGHIKKEEQCTPGNCSTTVSPYKLFYDYNLAGKMTHANDGIGQAGWFPQYDGFGRLSGVSATTIWPTQFYPSQLLSVQGYSPSGGFTSWTLGTPTSGQPALTVTQTYDKHLRPVTESVTGHD